MRDIEITKNMDLGYMSPLEQQENVMEKKINEQTLKQIVRESLKELSNQTIGSYMRATKNQRRDRQYDAGKWHAIKTVNDKYSFCVTLDLGEEVLFTLGMDNDEFFILVDVDEHMENKEPYTLKLMPNNPRRMLDGTPITETTVGYVIDNLRAGERMKLKGLCQSAIELNQALRGKQAQIAESVKEKAVSKSQQRFFGMVDAYKKGELDNPSKSVKDAADGMSMKQVKDFAKTKHKGLPNHVDESTLRNIIKNVLKEVYEVDNDEPIDDGDDENYINSAQYIFDLYVNGNKTQAALEMARAPKNNLIDVFRIAREAGDEEGIQQLYAYTDTDKFKFSQDLDDEHISNAALKSYCKKNSNLQEELDELSNDTIDSAYVKAMNDVNTLPYGTPERVRRDAQLKNIKKLRNDKLGFDPVDMSIKMRQQGTSGNPSIDRKWATWQKNHDDRISGRRTYDDKTGRWTTRLTENDLRNFIRETVQMHLVNVLGKYTQGKTSSKEANKAIMDLANSSNKKKVNEDVDARTAAYFDKIRNGECETLEFEGKIFSVPPQLKQIAQKTADKFGVKVSTYVGEDERKLYYGLLVDVPEDCVFPTLSNNIRLFLLDYDIHYIGWYKRGIFFYQQIMKKPY